MEVRDSSDDVCLSQTLIDWLMAVAWFMSVL